MRSLTTVLNVVLLGLLVLGSAACGGSEGAALNGIVRTPPLQVGDVRFASTRPSAALAGPGGSDSAFTMRAKDGELLLVYFGYTYCPDVCPTTLADLRVALSKLGDDADRITLAMVSVDPARDSLDVLSQYLGHFVDRFVAIRPDEGELTAAESAFLASSSVTTTATGQIEVSHTAEVYLVDETGRIIVEWAFGTEAGTIAQDLRSVFESRPGRSASPSATSAG